MLIDFKGKGRKGEKGRETSMYFCLDTHLTGEQAYNPSMCCDWYGEPFQAWEMWPSPHSEKPVGSEVPQAGPTPTDRFSCGESGLHCT